MSFGTCHSHLVFSLQTLRMERIWSVCWCDALAWNPWHDLAFLSQPGEDVPGEVSARLREPCSCNDFAERLPRLETLPASLEHIFHFWFGNGLEIWWLRKDRGRSAGQLLPGCTYRFSQSSTPAVVDAWLLCSWCSWKVNRKWKKSEINKSDLALQTNLKP